MPRKWLRWDKADKCTQKIIETQGQHLHICWCCCHNQRRCRTSSACNWEPHSISTFPLPTIFTVEHEPGQDIDKKERLKTATTTTTKMLTTTTTTTTTTTITRMMTTLTCSYSWTRALRRGREHQGGDQGRCLLWGKTPGWGGSDEPETQQQHRKQQSR